MKATLKSMLVLFKADSDWLLCYYHSSAEKKDSESDSNKILLLLTYSHRIREIFKVYGYS